MSTPAAIGQVAYVGVPLSHVGHLAARLDSLANPTPPILPAGGSPALVASDVNYLTSGPERQSPVRYIMRWLTAVSAVLITLIVALAIQAGTSLTLRCATRHQYLHSQAIRSSQRGYEPAHHRLGAEGSTRPPRRVLPTSPLALPNRIAPFSSETSH